MKVLIGCERFGRVRDAFASNGHDAWSCDLLPTESPGNHFQCDLLEVIDRDWDILIAFPDCTNLCVSGAWKFKEKQADGRQQASIDFFMKIANNKCPRIAIENPVGIMSSRWRKPDQIIQPFEYGHPESKKTCLWLKNLPLLRPTNILKKPERGYWDNQTPGGQNKLGPSPTRAAERGKTYLGIAKSMADQWGYFDF